ncbi:polyprenyl synthetase family protein [Streptomyces sp. 8L]|uniref:polyprenyl synthetase family protein n=1 Tax=Streptomyces sp. 8L TaxID=2877242 RepID=UPI001CD2B61C|nr:polyprenyl synthetase family protein [Streptomyces sp. 8L]MCA1217146.1 polyprenyl synthetase family protein [Streptomyces sp. 8L]
MPPEPAGPLDQQCRPEETLSAAIPRVREYLDGILDGYRTTHPHLHAPLCELVAHGRPSPHESTLPLLVHAALSGDPEPAVPVAAAHVLWWRAANTFDDAADGDTGHRLYGMPSAVALMAALECGYGMPLRALTAPPVPRSRRHRLLNDYLDGWTTAIDGQVGDLLHHPASVSLASVLDVYRHKSGAIYAMACALAARLAEEPGPSGPGTTRTADWKRFGCVLGLLAQLRNDEDDLRSERHEDLRNTKATFLLAHLLHSAPQDRRSQALALLKTAGSSTTSRRELHAMMRESYVLAPYHAYVGSLRREALALLDSLAPRSPYRPALGALVEAETGFLPQDHPDGASPPAQGPARR